MSDMSQLKEGILESMLPRLRADGFQVVLRPSQKALPPFLKDYRPDAVAYKGTRKIAIQVMSDGADVGVKFERIRRSFADQPDWELRLVYNAPTEFDGAVPVASQRLIEDRITQIEASLNSVGLSAALLAAWAAFEAAARAVLPTRFVTPQPPAQLLEVLAADGYITPDEADDLRELSRLRNYVAHGRLDIEPSREQVERVIAATRELLSLPE